MVSTTYTDMYVGKVSSLSHYFTHLPFRIRLGGESRHRIVVVVDFLPCRTGEGRQHNDETECGWHYCCNVTSSQIDFWFWGPGFSRLSIFTTYPWAGLTLVTASTFCTLRRWRPGNLSVSSLLFWSSRSLFEGNIPISFEPSIRWCFLLSNRDYGLSSATYEYACS